MRNTKRTLLSSMLKQLTEGNEAPTFYLPLSDARRHALADRPAWATSVLIVDRTNWPAPGDTNARHLYVEAHRLHGEGLKVRLVYEVLAPTAHPARLRRILSIPHAYGIPFPEDLKVTKNYVIDKKEIPGPGLNQADFANRAACNAQREFLLGLRGFLSESEELTVEAEFDSDVQEPELYVLWQSDDRIEATLVRGHFVAGLMDVEGVAGVITHSDEVRAFNADREYRSPVLLDRKEMWRQALLPELWARAEREVNLHRFGVLDPDDPKYSG